MTLLLAQKRVRGVLLAFVITIALTSAAYALVTFVRDVSATVSVTVKAEDGIEVYLDDGLVQVAETIEFGELEVDIFGTAGNDTSTTVWVKNSAFTEIDLDIVDDFESADIVVQGGAPLPPIAPDGVVEIDLSLDFHEQTPGDFEFVLSFNATDNDANDTIRFYDGEWQSLRINNAIAMYITEHGYDYPTESIVGNTSSMQDKLPVGELDVNMEMWRVNIIDWINEQVAEGNIIDLGETFERATQGWFVPTYVIEGDIGRGIDATAPDLVSVDDLADYEHVFEDPNEPDKGRLVNCIVGWQCEEINRVKLHTYGLGGDYNTFEPGNAGELDATIVDTYDNGDPVLSYYWEPTWLMGHLNLTQIEEPPYTEDCDDAIQEARDNDELIADEACAYPDFGVHKFVHSGLLEKAPAVAAFLNKMFVGTDRLNELTAYMETEEKTAEETAEHFLNTYQDQWSDWVPEEVFDRIVDSLQ